MITRQEAHPSRLDSSGCASPLFPALQARTEIPSCPLQPSYGSRPAHGHAAGDAVIRTTGERLPRWAAAHDATAARLGGDEFAALTPATALANITALREQLQRPLHHEGRALQMTVSVGIARAADLPGEGFGRILRGADTAMYKVKTGQAPFPYLATRTDAYTDTVNRRRAGRPGTHLPAA
ncbi:diguanylate cyclase domain-containing protein [Streptomyces sp. NPDC054775]